MNVDTEAVQVFAHKILTEYMGLPEESKFNSIGNQLYKAIQYGNVKIINDDLSKGILNLALVAYYQGVAPLNQIQGAIYLAREFNLEYPHALALRSFVELSGRVHKGVRLFDVYTADRNPNNFCEKTGRLLKTFIPGGEGGYNILTLVESLSNVLPQVKDEYDRLSDYLHGDFTYHALNRRASYWQSLKGEGSGVIARQEDFFAQLIQVTINDLEQIAEIARPFADRFEEYQVEHQLAEKKGSDEK